MIESVLIFMVVSPAATDTHTTWLPRRDYSRFAKLLESMGFSAGSTGLCPCAARAHVDGCRSPNGCPDPDGIFASRRGEPRTKARVTRRAALGRKPSAARGFSTC